MSSLHSSPRTISSTTTTPRSPSFSSSISAVTSPRQPHSPRLRSLSSINVFQHNKRMMKNHNYHNLSSPSSRSLSSPRRPLSTRSIASSKLDEERKTVEAQISSLRQKERYQKQSLSSDRLSLESEYAQINADYWNTQIEEARKRRRKRSNLSPTSRSPTSPSPSDLSVLLEEVRGRTSDLSRLYRWMVDGIDEGEEMLRKFGFDEEHNHDDEDNDIVFVVPPCVDPDHDDDMKVIDFDDEDQEKMDEREEIFLKKLLERQDIFRRDSDVLCQYGFSSIDLVRLSQEYEKLIRRIARQSRKWRYQREDEENENESSHKNNHDLPRLICSRKSETIFPTKDEMDVSSLSDATPSVPSEPTPRTPPSRNGSSVFDHIEIELEPAGRTESVSDMVKRLYELANDKDELENVIAIQNEKISHQSSELESVNSKCDEMCAYNAVLTEENDGLKKQVSRLDLRLNELRVTLDGAVSDVRQLQEENVKLNEMMDEAKLKMVKEKKRAHKLSKKVVEYDDRVKRMQAKLRVQYSNPILRVE